MPTKQEIKQKYQFIHDTLTQNFYVEKTLDKVTFDTEHAKCWRDMQQELITNGYMTSYWSYTFQATVTTPIGDIPLTINFLSPIKLTQSQIVNNIDRIKTANWTMTVEQQQYEEVLP